MMNDPQRDAEILRVAERLSILGHNYESAELAQHAFDLRVLVISPACRWCGSALDVTTPNYGLGAMFCSTTCREVAFLSAAQSDEGEAA